MPHSFARQSPYLGALLLVFSKAKFLEIAVSHGMAVNLEDMDQAKRAHERGIELLVRWEETYRTDYSEMQQAISAALWSSFWIILSVMLAACLIGYYSGRIGPALPIDIPKAIAFVGTGLVAWATLMELGGNFHVWDGRAFPQIAHSILFKSIFVPGVAMIMIPIGL